MKIAQINAQRAMAAAANLEILISELNIDVLCIQEPYVYKNIVRGYSSHNFSILQPGVDNPWVAAVIANEKLEVFHMGHFDTPHIMCFQIMSEKEEFYIINVYCQFSLQIEGILNDLEKIISKLNSSRLIITMDANAKSELWHAEETDERGRVMEEFLMSGKLYVRNEANNLPTFETVNGQSNVDITIISEDMIGSCTSWNVSPVCTTSDHNLIIFEVTSKYAINRKFIKYNGFNIKRANWNIFKNLLEIEFEESKMDVLYNSDSEKAARLFNDSLNRVCEKSIPEKKCCNQSVPWWNEELSKMRKDLNRARRNITRNKKLHLLDCLESAKLNYKRIRNKYVAGIRRAKQKSWQNFVTKETNKDPWSIPYKIVRDKIKKNEIVTSVILKDGSNTKTWEETIKAFIDKCVSKNDKTIETNVHKRIIREVEEYKNYNLENVITMNEIGTAINKLKNNTAPGIDKFTTEIIKQVWNTIPNSMYNILNNCMRNKVFPRLWKKSKLKIILKGSNKDKKQLNSYRPISLIPTMSKIFERIIMGRIQENYKQQGLENSNQYGFRPGKSTEDAILHLTKSIKQTNKKYVVALFIDIQGAFDSIWWPAIVHRLTKANCSSTLISLIKSYFRNRKVLMFSKYKVFSATMEKGCPQGSILGPMAWNWCMDSLLNSIMETFAETQIEVVAYADDVVALIKEDSRNALEKTANNLVKIIMEWCLMHKLKLAADKTVAMLMKGKLDKERPPIIKIYDTRVKFSQQTKYLGVILDNKLSFTSHARYLRDKLINIVMAIRRIAKEKWGIKRQGKRILYNMVAMPIATYASSMWIDKIGSAIVKRHITAAQRSLLIMITGAARTTSTIAMQAVAGIEPLDLSIIKQGLKNRVRKNQTITWGNYTYMEHLSDDRNIKEEYSRIETEVRKVWQQRWMKDDHARQTYRFIPQVDFYLENRWFEPSRGCIYLLTGYGPINDTLHKRGAEKTDKCPICKDEIETVEHMIFKCQAYQRIRYQELRQNDKIGIELIETEEKFIKFNAYSKEIFEIRNTYLKQLEVDSGPPPRGRDGQRRI